MLSRIQEMLPDRVGDQVAKQVPDLRPAQGIREFFGQVDRHRPS